MLEIIKYPNPILKQKSEKIEIFDSSLLDIAKEMRELMKAAKGLGLSAPQVGILKQIIVINTDDVKTQAIFNPKISFPKNAQLVSGLEGCLSLPGIEGKVARYNILNLQYQDVNGKFLSIKAGGLMAACIQHEVDHLFGRMFFQKMNKKNYKEIEEKIQELELNYKP